MERRNSFTPEVILLPGWSGLFLIFVFKFKILTPWQKAERMAQWNAYYQNEDNEEGQDEGEEAGGGTRAAVV